MLDFLDFKRSFENNAGCEATEIYSTSADRNDGKKKKKKNLGILGEVHTGHNNSIILSQSAIVHLMYVLSMYLLGFKYVENIRKVVIKTYYVRTFSDKYYVICMHSTYILCM